MAQIYFYAYTAQLLSPIHTEHVHISKLHFLLSNIETANVWWRSKSASWRLNGAPCLSLHRHLWLQPPSASALSHLFTLRLQVPCHFVTRLHMCVCTQVFTPDLALIAGSLAVPASCSNLDGSVDDRRPGCRRQRERAQSFLARCLASSWPVSHPDHRLNVLWLLLTLWSIRPKASQNWPKRLPGDRRTPLPPDQTKSLSDVWSQCQVWTSSVWHLLLPTRDINHRLTPDPRFYTHLVFCLSCLWWLIPDTRQCLSPYICHGSSYPCHRIQAIDILLDRVAGVGSLSETTKYSFRPCVVFFFPKTLQKLPKSTRKQALRKVSENSPKAGSLKACRLLLKALRKQDDFCWKLYKSFNKFCDKIVYFGGPSRKDLSFGADPDCSATAGSATSATLHLDIVSGNRSLYEVIFTSTHCNALDDSVSSTPPHVPCFAISGCIFLIGSCCCVLSECNSCKRE